MKKILALLFSVSFVLLSSTAIAFEKDIEWSGFEFKVEKPNVIFVKYTMKVKDVSMRPERRMLELTVSDNDTWAEVLTMIQANLVTVEQANDKGNHTVDLKQKQKRGRP